LFVRNSEKYNLFYKHTKINLFEKIQKNTICENKLIYKNIKKHIVLFRERLLRANTEAFELETQKQARISILEAYEGQKDENEERENNQIINSGERLQKAVEKMRTELGEIERRHSVLMENRHKLEAALRKGEQNMRSIETRMR